MDVEQQTWEGERVISISRVQLLYNSRVINNPEFLDAQYSK